MIGQVGKFTQEVRQTLTQISWPTREKVLQLTVVVIFVSVVVGIFLGGIDFLLTKGLEFLALKWR